MTVEEIEIIVTAKVEEALKEFGKILPAIKQTIRQAQEAFSKVDTRAMTSKLQQAVNLAKKKMQNLKKSSENNEIAIKVNNKDAQKQISQVQKQIDSLQEKINARQMKLNVINPQIDKIVDDTRKSVTPEGISPNDKAMDTTVNNALGNNKDFTVLNNQAQKLYTEIEMYNKQLSEAKNKMTQLKQEINQTATTQNKLGSFFSVFKQKTEQVKNNMSNMKNSFKGLPKVTQNIYNNIKGMGVGLKSGLRNVLKYATALFSLRSIYSALSGSANAWLSSQNARAKQLSENINYMKYAMGSVFAPVIEYVTNLVYNLMKAVQSLVYAFSGVNIFAKATASSMKNAAGSAKQTSKSLSGIHNEINNISYDKNSGGNGTPNIDLSQIDNASNSIIEMIKNGNWYEIGKTIGNKLNNTIKNIDWNKIKNLAKDTGTNIARLFNGFVEKTDWYEIGKTISEGINTAVGFTESLIKETHWDSLGNAIGVTIGSAIANIDWTEIGRTIGKSIYSIKEFFIEIGQGVIDGIFQGIAEKMGKGGAWRFFRDVVVGPIIKHTKELLGIHSPSTVMRDEVGVYIGEGLLQGISKSLLNIGQWIYQNVFAPFIEGFKSAFGIHSPSTVMEEQGKFIVEGLENGLLGMWNKVKQPFIDLKNNMINKFAEIKDNIVSWSENTKTIILSWGNTVKNKMTSVWNYTSQSIKNSINFLKNDIETGLNNAKGIVLNWESSLKNIFSNLGNNASIWGKDLVSNMASGIRNTAHKVGSAVQSVASKIKGFLGFSEPEEGPLSNFHTYMPDMIDLMVKGIKDNVGKVKSEIENLAGTMSYTINTEAVTGIPSTNPTIKPVNVKANNMLDTLSDIAYKENENNKPIYLTVNVGSTKLGQILLDNLRDMKRQSGKDIEALVGG